MPVLTSKYTKKNLISENLIAYYYKGKQHSTGKTVFICEFKLDFLNASIIHQLIRDSEKLVKFKHPSVLQLIDFQYDGKLFYGIYEFPRSLITLEEFLKKKGKEDIKLLWKIAVQIITGLTALEKAGLVHGNLNLSSIYIDKNKDIQFSKVMLPLRVFSATFKQFSVIEDCIFYAPEFVQRQDYSIRSDIYSFGILLYVFFGKDWPYKYSNFVVDNKKALLKDRVTFTPITKKIPEKLGMIVDLCVQKDPSRRFESFEMLMDQYKNETFNTELTKGSSKVEQHLREELQQSLVERLRKSMRVVGVFMSGGFLLLVTYFLYLWYLTAIPNTQVPDVVGLSYEKAEVLLNESGLKSVIAGEWYHSQYDEGIIVDSKPPAGKNVKISRSIRLFLSKGKTQVFVPELVGRNIVQAVKVLEGYGDGIDINVSDEEYSNVYPKGVIVFQIPTYNNVLHPSENLQVVISKGFPVEMSIQNSRELIIGAKDKLKLVVLDFSVLEGWNPQEISIMYHYKDVTEALYFETHEPGEEVHLEFELEKGGVIEVYYNDQQALKEKIRVKKYRQKRQKVKQIGSI